MSNNWLLKNAIVKQLMLKSCIVSYSLSIQELITGLINMSDNKEFLFIQYRLNEHRSAFLNGELRITQQQYYRYLRSAVSDSLEGEQRLHANGKQFTLFGNHSTYIWSCSAVYSGLSDIKKFDGYDVGLMILDQSAFIKQVCKALKNTPILKNHADVSFEPVIYTDKKEPLAENKSKPLSRWTKPLTFSDECEYRLCVHNVPPLEFIEKYHPKEHHRVEKVYTPNEKVKTKQSFSRLVFNILFDFEYELYSFNGKEWCKEPI